MKTIVSCVLDKTLKNNQMKRLSGLPRTNLAFCASSNRLNKVEESINEWAMMNDINLLVVTDDDLYLYHGLYYDDLSPTYPLRDDLFTAISKPNTVIFIKNAHQMGDTNDRRRIINLVCDNYQIPTTNDFKQLDNLLFAVMTYDRSSKTSHEFNDLFVYDAKERFNIIDLDDNPKTKHFSK